MESLKQKEFGRGTATWHCRAAVNLLLVGWAERLVAVSLVCHLSKPGLSSRFVKEHQMQRELIKHVLKREDFGATVTVAGWIRTRRDSKGGFSFIELTDGSTMTGLQVVADNDLPNYESDVLSLTIGSSARVTGTLTESPGKGQRVEIKATEVEPFGLADPETYPLQKKRVSFEHLREIAHLRPRTNTIGAVARVRNALSVRDASVLPGPRLPLPPHPAHHGE